MACSLFKTKEKFKLIIKNRPVTIVNSYGIHVLHVNEKEKTY